MILVTAYAVKLYRLTDHMNAQNGHNEIHNQNSMGGIKYQTIPADYPLPIVVGTCEAPRDIYKCEAVDCGSGCFPVWVF